MMRNVVGRSTSILQVTQARSMTPAVLGTLWRIKISVYCCNAVKAYTILKRVATVWSASVPYTGNHLQISVTNDIGKSKEEVAILNF